MPTTFNWIFLGNSATSMDPTEGNNTAANASALNGQTFGSAGNPLFSHIASATMINNGGNATALDQDNNASNDQFTTNNGSGTATYTFDSCVLFNVTITYADGTTASTAAAIVQDTAGNLYLAPDSSLTGNAAVYEAKPIRSLRLDSVSNDTWAGLNTNRWVTGFDDSYIDGTYGDDVIDGSYAEPVANGTDKVDNGDAGLAGSSGNDDYIRAGSGNDTVYSGLGNDSVYGGDGADSAFGGDGNDLLHGWAGNDRLFGNDGNDTLTGGAGADVLSGGLGTDTADYSASASGVTVNLATGAGSGGDAAGDTFSGIEVVVGSANADNLTAAGTVSTLYGSGGDDTLSGGAGADNLFGGSGVDVLKGGAGHDTLTGGSGDDVLRFETASGNDSVTDFDLADSDSNGFTNDQLDVSGLVDGFGSPVNTFDVVVTDDGSGNAVMTFPGGESVTLIGVAPAFAANRANMRSMGTPCFVAGTRILTPDGEVAVEALRPGMLVCTLDHGVQPVLWAGGRRVDQSELAACPELRPVRIRDGTLGNRGDLCLSPQHAVLWQDRLVRAKHLAEYGGGRFRVQAGRRQVSYHHILFAAHQIVMANGAPCESFYPGVMALEALEQQHWGEIGQVLPALAGTVPGYGEIETRYGPRVRPLLGSHAVALLFGSSPIPRQSLPPVLAAAGFAGAVRLN